MLHTSGGPAPCCIRHSREDIQASAEASTQIQGGFERNARKKTIVQPGSGGVLMVGITDADCQVHLERVVTCYIIQPFVGAETPSEEREPTLLDTRSCDSHRCTT